MSKPTTLLYAVCLTLACLSTAMAQGGGGGGGKGGRGGGPGGPGGGRGMDAAMLGGQAGGNQFNQPNLNQANMPMAGAMQNQNQNQNQQNMPTVAQLAATLMTAYDSDGSGALDATELQAALTGLRSLMMANNQNNQQNGMAGMNANANADNQPARPPRRR